MLHRIGLLFYLTAVAAFAQLGQVSGVVVSGDNSPVAGAKVTVRGGPAPRETSAGRDGSYRVPDLAPGNYSITVEAEGFLPVTRNFTITGAESLVRRFLLRVAPISDTEPGPIIDSVQSAAAARPAFLPGSELAPSSTITATGRFLGPETAATASHPLPDTLAGVRLIVSHGDVRTPLYLVSVKQDRLIAVLPSGVSAGFASLTAEYQGKESPPTM
ncbi:MAG: hypothetical protein FJW39_28450 [Acidobacteria bacterium]|nr:hypothetical protein [Acidobacteriota bacterium]